MKPALSTKTETKYYELFGVCYFLFIVNGNFFYAREEGYCQKSNNKIEVPHLKNFEITAPSPELVVRGNNLIKKAQEGNLPEWECSKEYQEKRREQWEVGKRIFCPNVHIEPPF